MVALRKTVVILAVALLAVCGIAFFASPAQASPPRYAAIKAGPANEFPMIGYVDSHAPPAAQCWAPPGSAAVNYWLRVTYNGVTGYVADVPYGSVHGGENTPACPAPSAVCLASGFRNTIVQWDNATGPNTSWYVDEDCHRRWIETTGVFGCLVGQGVVDKKEQSAPVLDSLIDLNGVWAKCRTALPVG